MEAACQLHNKGLEVEVVEMATRVFPRQLDEEGSEIFEATLGKKGIKVFKNHFVKTITGDGKATGVELDNGKVVRADTIIVSAGVKPNKELVDNTNIEINRGVVVNAKMETNIKDIYACGDIAEFEGLVQGLWATAIDQGKVAGANAIGDTLEYKYSIQPVMFNEIGIEVFSIGTTESDEEIHQVISHIEKVNYKYKKLYFHNDTFIGGILLGDTNKSSILINGLKGSHTIDDLAKKLYK